jgi:hypothetical protein
MNDSHHGYKVEQHWYKPYDSKTEGQYNVALSSQNHLKGRSAMNTYTEKSASARATHIVSAGLLAAGVAALVVVVNHLIDNWAQTHLLAAWLALWVVAVLAITTLRGASGFMAQSLMAGLDAWSVQVARRRADQRLWAMAQSDGRIMRELQTAMDRAEDRSAPAADLTTWMSRRVVRMVNHRYDHL